MFDLRRAKQESGFRRPGYFIAAVPGVSYAFGSQTITLSVAITLERNRQKNAFGEPGDATLADYAVFVSWSVRF